MPSRKKTAFDKYRDRKLRDPELAAEYRNARAEIDAIDLLIRGLDEARVRCNLSKAELAQRIGATPEAIRRLFTATSPNPTLLTLLKIALALGLRLELVNQKPKGSRSVPRPRQVAPLRGQ